MVNVVRWNPWGNVGTLQDRINRLFEEVLPRSEESGDLTRANWWPLVDTYETENAVVIEMDLPGLKKEDVTIDVRDRVLTIKGERTAESEAKEENYYRRERSYGAFQRAFTLTDYVDPDRIRANFKDGVLKIEIPKPEEKKPKQISID